MSNEKEEREDRNLQEEVSREWEEIVSSESDRLENMEKQVTDRLGSRESSLFGWLSRLKRSFGRLLDNLTPLQRYGVAGGAMAAVLLGLLLGWFLSPSVDSGGRTVVFKVPASKAQSVELAGDFSGFKPIEMKDENGDGTWTLRMKLGEGKYEYYYLVNGEKKSERYPLADEVVRDWDNTKNGIRYIGEKDRGSGEKSGDAKEA